MNARPNLRTAVIEGELTLGRVREIHDRFVADGHYDALDLSGVSRVDSAGLALIVHLAAHIAKKTAAPPGLIDAPPDLLALAALHGVERFLSMGGSPDCQTA